MSEVWEHFGFYTHADGKLLISKVTEELLLKKYNVFVRRASHACLYFQNKTWENDQYEHKNFLRTFWVHFENTLMTMIIWIV